MNQATKDLFEAVRKNRESDIRKALEAGADINAKDGDGNTILHVAAGEGLPGIVIGLVGRGADINIRNNAGETAIDVAKKNKDSARALKFLENSRMSDIQENVDAMDVDNTQVISRKRERNTMISQEEGNQNKKMRGMKW